MRVKTTTAPCAATRGAAGNTVDSSSSAQHSTLRQSIDCVRYHPRVLFWLLVLGSLNACQPVDAAANLGDNARVPFNSGTGNASPNIEADSRRTRHFLRPSYATSAPSMAGRGGEPSGCRFLYAGLANPAMCLPPRMQAGCGSKPIEEATMPSVALRAFRALFPVYAIPVSTLPTLPEARALAALLVSRGKRVAIQPAAQGFAVSEVTA